MFVFLRCGWLENPFTLWAVSALSALFLLCPSNPDLEGLGKASTPPRPCPRSLALRLHRLSLVSDRRLLRRPLSEIRLQRPPCRKTSFEKNIHKGAAACFDGRWQHLGHCGYSILLATPNYCTVLSRNAATMTLSCSLGTHA